VTSEGNSELFSARQRCSMSGNRLNYQGTRDAFLRAARSTNSAMLPGEFEAGPGVTVVEPLGSSHALAHRQMSLSGRHSYFASVSVTIANKRSPQFLTVGLAGSPVSANKRRVARGRRARHLELAESPATVSGSMIGHATDSSRTESTRRSGRPLA
jgi:hypothetical protein